MNRADRAINFDWREGVSPELKENFSVRWTGTLLPPVTGDYEIGFNGSDSFQVWLDNQLIAQSGSSDTSKTRVKKIHLQGGRGYALKIECAQEGPGGSAKLVWRRPGYGNDYAAAMKQADLIVVVLGLAGELEGEEMPITIPGFRGGDRVTIDLPALSYSVCNAR